MTNRKANAAYYRANQRCVRCGAQDAFTLIGKRLCAECTAKAAQSCKRYEQEHRQERTAYKREWRQKCRDAGLCPRCAKPVDGGYVICKRCRVKDNVRREKKRRENGVSPYYMRDESVCWTCKKRPVMEGKKLCLECYEKSVRNVAKARAKQVELGVSPMQGIFTKCKS